MPTDAGGSLNSAGVGEQAAAENQLQAIAGRDTCATRPSRGTPFNSMIRRI